MYGIETKTPLSMSLHELEDECQKLQHVVKAWQGSHNQTAEKISTPCAVTARRFDATCFTDCASPWEFGGENAHRNVNARSSDC